MKPFDLRVEIENAIKGIPGLRVTGADSMMVPPYGADIGVVVERDGVEYAFGIRIDAADAQSEPC
jgi:hypothetical protein